MITKNELSVPEILEMACKLYNGGRPLLGTKRTSAEKRIRRCLQADFGMSGPYKVGAQLARDIVKIHLSEYFEKTFYDAKKEAQYRQKRERAREALAAQRSYLENANGERDEELEALQLLQTDERYKHDYSLEEDKFERIMLRALFYKAFEGFDETAFRLDYAEKAKINDLLGTSADPDDLRDIHEAMRYQELSEKLDPAIERGDVSHYLPKQHTPKIENQR